MLQITAAAELQAKAKYILGECPIHSTINSHIFGEEKAGKIMREGDINRKNGAMGKKDLSSTDFTA